MPPHLCHHNASASYPSSHDKNKPIIAVSTDVSAAINNSDEARTFKTNRFAENIRNYKSGKDVLTGKMVNVTGEITMEPKSVLVLELQ